MVIGGSDATGSTTKTVELFNWKTRQQCLISSLPTNAFQQFGNVIEDRPMSCGGSTTACYKYIIENDKWITVLFFWHN
jgi:hypothetical protein